jgi:hypothetical protein
MAALEPIRTDLFRFVTIRTPQLLSQDRKRLGFIFHPDPERSVFLSAVTSTNIVVARDEVRAPLGSFDPFDRYEEVRAVKPDLFDFAVWLARNRHRLEDESALAEWSGVQPLPRPPLLTLWDNIFYYTLRPGHPSIPQACVEMIVADNFIRVRRGRNVDQFAEQLFVTPRLPDAPPSEQRLTLLLKRVAAAKVVIPKVFSAKKAAAPGTTVAHDWSPGGLADLHTAHDLAVGRQQYAGLQTVDAELRSVQDAARNARVGVQAVLRGDVPIEQPLSPTARAYLESLGDTSRTMLDARRALGRRMRGLARAVGGAIRSGRKVVVSRGKVFRPDRAGRYLYTFSLRAAAVGYEAFLTLGIGGAEGYIVDADYALRFEEAEALRGGAVRVVRRTGGTLTLHLFPDQRFSANDRHTYRFDGRFILSGERCIEIHFESSLQANDASGNAVPCATPGPDQPTPDEPASAGVELFGVTRLGVADLRKVEQEVCCYVPGQVSRIENILAREYKERATRSLTTSETTEEETVEVETETQSDTATTSRNELLKEIANVVSDASTTSYGGSVGVSGSMFGATVEADAYIDHASSTSGSYSDAAAQNYAEEVTAKALERVLRNTTTKRTSRILEEFEETNKHGFDNREGDAHVTGVYRWVDVVYKNRLVNYGKRLMYEFVVPEPARLYRAALKQLAEDASEADAGTTVLTEPVPLGDNGVISASDITVDSYRDLARAYDVSLPEPPSPETKSSTQSFSPPDDPKGNEKVYNFTFFLDPNYRADQATVTLAFNYLLYSPNELGTYFTATVGGERLHYDEGNLARTGTSRDDTIKVNTVGFDETWVGSLPIKVEIKNVHGFTVTVELTMAIEDHVMEEWAAAAYDTLVRGYEAQVTAYEAELAAAAAEAAEAAAEAAEAAPDTTLNRAIEQRELKRTCIEMLTRPFGIEVGQDFYTRDTTCAKVRIPYVEQSAAWESYAALTKFFEQVFEWESMAYLFYPYYWADKCRWYELLQSASAGDLVFEGFMQSGAARVLVPVRPGFEDALCYYVDTGTVWSGGDIVLETDDDLYTSILEELQSLDGFVEAEWKTRVPTTLTIVQGTSVYLEDEGLPCCEDFEADDLDTGFRPSTALLGGTTTTDPDVVDEDATADAGVPQ